MRDDLHEKKKKKVLDFFLVLAEGELHNDRANRHDSSVFVHLEVAGSGRLCVISYVS